MRAPLVAGLFILASACQASSGGFTADDDAQVRALEEAYRAGWVANDSAAVMATIAPNAVLMPAGLQPLVGDTAIRRYWWPSDGSVTTIESYDIDTHEVQGSGDLAYLRGRGSLAFTYRDSAGTESRLTSNAVHLSVARRGTDGTWNIVRRAWSAIR